MSNISTFHSQLSSIMEVLANAAVAEICELVDNGYAVLHLEISRSQKENKALKRKIHMLELRIARGSEERGPRETSVNSCSERVQKCEEIRQTTRGDSHFPAVERDPGGQLGLWRGGETTAVTDGEETAPQATTMDQTTDAEEQRAESVVIKKEKLEEDVEHCESGGTLKSREERAVETTTDGGERASIVETQTAPAVDTEELPEQHKTRHSVWEDSGLDTVLKAEPANETVNLPHTRSEHSEGRLNSLADEYVLYERSGQLDTFFSQRNAEAETDGPVQSYPTQNNSESLSIHSETLLCQNTDSGVDNHLSPLGSLNVKDMIDSISSKLEVDMSSSWTKEAVSGSTLKQQRYYKEDGKRGTLQHENVMNICPLVRDNASNSDSSDMIGYVPSEESLNASRSIPANNRTGGREKRFLCTYCWKSFTCPKNLETHQRVHTGEKPFGCTQCGKRFSQSAHLKKHHSVHTGEKPFRCTKCGKCFSDSSNLKRHQYVHTGERPFRCTQCGKRFSFLGNLKRHQSVHIGKKPLSHTPWEEFTFYKSP